MERYERDTEVLSLDGLAASQWYHAVQTAGHPVPTGFNWQGLAQGAALRARITEAEESLAWAEMSVAVYGRLSKEYPEKTFDQSEMYCRASTIEKHGIDGGHHLRNPDVIFDWFRETAPVDVAGVQALIDRLADPMTVEFEEQVVKPLRDLKERLHVLRALEEDCAIPQDIAAYFPFWHDLP